MPARRFPPQNADSARPTMHRPRFAKTAIQPRAAGIVFEILSLAAVKRR